MTIHGLHHVTAIAGDPQRNLDFYAGVLGLRLVKRTVNFDDPGSYHFYFGDAAGTPGTILTFFPWPQARPGVRGTGEVESTAFAVPAAAVDAWTDHLARHGVAATPAAERFGERVIRFADPDGMEIELVAVANPVSVAPWNENAAPAGQPLRGFHGVTLALADCEPTADLLAGVFGYRRLDPDGSRHRLVAPGGETAPGLTIDLLSSPARPRGRSGAGSVHHIAFRVPDDAAQFAWREKLLGLGYGVSPVMDRTYFRSIYFREPGGVLFEIATDPPGFAVDEAPAELGRSLRLPPAMERARPQIEAVLPAITLPRNP